MALDDDSRPLTAMEQTLRLKLTEVSAQLARVEAERDKWKLAASNRVVHMANGWEQHEKELTAERDAALADGEAWRLSLSTAEHSIRRLTTERDAAVRERDGLHTSLKAVADLCIDKAGLRAMEVVGEDSPPRAVAKIIEQRDAAIARAEQAERERDAANRECVGIVNAVIGAPQNTAVIAVVEHAIASWLDERSKHHGYLHDKAADQDARDEHGWAARAADEGEG
jgi:hypothetical protein